MKAVKICLFALGRSQRGRKRVVWEVTVREGVIQDTITLGPARSLLKTGSHREHKLPPLCLGEPVVKERIPMSSSRGIDRERARGTL